MPKKKDDDLDLRFDPRAELGLDPKCTFDVHIGEDGVGPKSDDGPAPDDPDVIDLGQPPDYAYYSREDPTAYDVKPLGPKKELRKNKEGLIMPNQDPRFDVPVIGRDTVELLRRVGAVGLAVEAGQTVFLQRDAALSSADQAGIVILGVAEDGPGEGLL